MTIKRKTLLGIAGIVLLALLLGCGGKASLSNMTARELFDKGMEKYNDNKYRPATEYFQAIVYDYPGESLVDTAQYYLALSYFGNEEFLLAQVEFNRLINYYTSSVFVPHSAFMKAVSLFEGTPENPGLDQTDLTEALRQFEDFIIDYPQSELVADAQTYIRQAQTRLARKTYDAAFTYFRMGARDAAIKYFQMVIDNYTGSDFAAPSLYYIAELERRKANFDVAAKKFENFVAVYPDDEKTDQATEKAAESYFKAAEAAFEGGDMVAARTKFENFLSKYPEDDRVDEANEFLSKIGNVPVGNQPEEAEQES